MKKSVLIVAAALTITGFLNQGFAQVKQDTAKTTTNTTVAATPPAGGADLIGVIAANPQLSTLGKVIRVGRIESSFQAAGPYTLFAPTNSGFIKLGQAGLDSLIKDSTKLQGFLKYHVVVGKYTKDDIVKALSTGNKLTLNTLGGGTLQLAIGADKSLEITDAKGKKAYITAFDQTASNGVVHSVDHTLTP